MAHRIESLGQRLDSVEATSQRVCQSAQNMGEMVDTLPHAIQTMGPHIASLEMVAHSPKAHLMGDRGEMESYFTEIARRFEAQNNSNSTLDRDFGLLWQEIQSPHHNQGVFEIKSTEQRENIVELFASMAENTASQVGLDAGGGA